MLTHALRVALAALLFSMTGVPPANATTNDFDGDGRGDVAVYRPRSGTWFIMMSGSTPVSVRWGAAGDLPVAGDYDGDRRADVAVFRPSTGVWYIIESATGIARTIRWGTRGDVPAPADFDGDGRWDPAVFRPSTGVWHQLRSTVGPYALQWGTSGDVPIPADYDGDGSADPAVYRRVGSTPRAQGVWFQLLSASGSGQTIRWGAADDIPVAADFDGDGKADPSVFRQGTGVWYQLRTASNTDQAVRWGAPGDVPVVGDYDGDGRADATVFRPSSGEWFEQRSGGAVHGPIRWGRDGDKPLPDPRKAGVTVTSRPVRSSSSPPKTESAPPRTLQPAGAGAGKLRVMTWNIHFGKTGRGVLNIDAQARVMANSNPDVILLQEVSTWDGDQPNTLPAKLAALTGHRWSKVWSSHNGSGTGEGTLILARIPVMSSSIANYYNRGFSRVAVSVNGVTIDIFNGHLEYYDTTKRSNQLRSWLAWMDGFSGPEIAGGDFNSWWGQSWIKTMENKYTDTWQDVTGSDENGYTLNNVRFDYLFRSRDSASRLVPTRCWVVSTSTSDHRPVVADYTVR